MDSMKTKSLIGISPLQALLAAGFQAMPAAHRNLGFCRYSRHHTFKRRELVDR